MKALRIALLLPILLAGCTSSAPGENAVEPVSVAAQPDALRAGFRDPPATARPRVWWHWLDGNVTMEGIAADFAWFDAMGIGGVQNFDVDLSTPQMVDDRLVYMSPEWREAFQFAVSEANRLDLEFAIASSPGWSETGGPWVAPEDGLKKLVWSETLIEGGTPFRGIVPPPPSVTGPYQDIPFNDITAGPGPHPEKPEFYADVALLAIPDARTNPPLPTPTFHDSDGSIVDGSNLLDNDLRSGVALQPAEGEALGILTASFDQPQSVRSVTLFVPNGALTFAALVSPVLEASEDGETWTKIADIAAARTPTTVSFAPVEARYFRVVIGPNDGLSQFVSGDAEGLERDARLAAFAGMASMSWSINTFHLSAEPEIDYAQHKAGFAIARDYFALGTIADDARGIDPGQVIDLSGMLQPDGSLDWTPPEGQWRLLRLGYSLLGTTNGPAPDEATGLEVDKYDGDAVRRYMEHYLGMYRDAAGDLGEQGVNAILTDSIEVGAANWTPRMIEQFAQLRGYDPTPFLPALTGTIVGTREQSDAFLFDFRRTLADLLASEHYGVVAEVAHENGLRVYGEALEDGRPSLGDDMTMRSHADVPMAAMWTREHNFTYLADTKGASSVAHLYGQNIAAAESMTSSRQPYVDSPRTLRPVIDLEFVQGINLPVIHTSVHQPIDDLVPGMTLMWFGQNFHRHDAWAPLARPWVDYIARNSFLLQQGVNVADVAYFHGEEGPLTGLYGDQRIADGPTAYAYDFVSFDALVYLLGNDGADIVAPSGARYRALYLGGSSHRMTLPALRKIAALVEGGATVIGMPPEADPGLAGDAEEFAALVGQLWSGEETTRFGEGRVLALSDVEAGLRMIDIAPDFHFSGGSEAAEIPFVHRRLTDGDNYFLVNRLDRPERIEARFRVTGRAPEIWHADSSAIEQASYRIERGETIVQLTLDAQQSLHVVFRTPAEAAERTVSSPAQMVAAQLDGGWDVAFEEGRGAPASIRLDDLVPLETHADPGIRYFSGIATYSNDFDTPHGWQPGDRLWVDLGEVREVAEIWVNGTMLGGVWHAPYRLDIGAALHAGTNRLEVRVGNLWINRLIGDAQPDVEGITFTAGPKYRADAPLRPSGLIGPVTLWVEE